MEPCSTVNTSLSWRQRVISPKKSASSQFQIVQIGRRKFRPSHFTDRETNINIYFCWNGELFQSNYFRTKGELEDKYTKGIYHFRFIHSDLRFYSSKTLTSASPPRNRRRTRKFRRLRTKSIYCEIGLPQ